MKKVISVSLVFVAILAITAMTFAQPGGGRGQGQGRQQGGQPGGPGAGGPMGGGLGMGMFGGGPGGGGGQQLLRSEDAVKAIGLSEKQLQDLRDIRPEGVDFAAMRDMSQTERQAAMEKVRADVEKKLNAIVTPEQIKKAQTISFQMAGGLDGWPRPAAADNAPAGGPGRGMQFQMTALNNDFAMAALGLTDAQKKSIADIRAEMRPAGPPAQGERPNFEEMQKRREEANKKIVALLTDEQKALAKKLIAEAPDFVKPENRVRPGAGNNPGGRNANPNYTPGDNTWQPGQGAGGARREARGAFPVE